jgi:hypothetical protein
MNGAWMVYENAGGSTTYFGTKMAVTFDSDDVYDKGSATLYSDCNGDVCDTCDSEGQTATAMLCIAFICIFPILIMSYLRMAADSNMNKVVAVVCTLLSLLFVIISMSAFSNCHDKYENCAGIDEDKLSYGPGFIVLGINILTLFVLFLLHLLLTA